MVSTVMAGPPPVKRRVELPQGVVVSVPGLGLYENHGGDP